MGLSLRFTVAGTTYAVDHRQPGNQSDTSTTAPVLPSLTTLPAAFRPWDEPYIKNVTPPTTTTYNPVQTTALAGYPAEPRTGYTASEVTFKSGSDDKKLTYETYGGFLPADLSVSSVALAPALGSKLPVDDTAGEVRSKHQAQPDSDSEWSKGSSVPRSGLVQRAARVALASSGY